MTTTDEVDVVVVGAGPAGLSAAIELRQRGAGRVVVFERELVAGGIPRHTAHLGYGMRDLHRVTTGPRYAALLTRRAEEAGVQIKVGRTVESFTSERVTTSGTEGPAEMQARAVLLATGVRERPRSARLVPGDRPAGVMTTGALQQFTTLHEQRVGTRAVVVGAEHVSFSAVLTLAHAGCRTVAMVTSLPQHQTYPLLKLVTAGRHRVPIHTGVEIAEVIGGRRVEAVVLTNGRRVACDTVVFTGDWIPDHELARRGGLAMLPVAKAPIIDGGWHTPQPGIYAIGNLVHPAETADVCALDGRGVAKHVMDWLSFGEWPSAIAPITVAEPIRWAAPSSRGVTFRVGQFVTGSIAAHDFGEVIHRTKRKHWIPNRAYHLPAVASCSELSFSETGVDSA